MASVLYDDSNANIRYEGGQWNAVTAERFFGGSSVWPAFALNSSGDTGVYGTVNFEFQGTDITFFGNTPSPPASQSIMVSIDGSPQYNTSYMDPAPPSSRQWYRSPTLSDGTHNITISHIAGTSVDFIVVSGGKSTPLIGETLIVDDMDESMIEYQGTWMDNRDLYAANDDPPKGLPYGNSTHQTSTPGSSATLRFGGSSISVFSLYSWDILGSLEVLYTLDGTQISRTYSITPATPEFKKGVRTREHFLLFSSNDTLSAGEHTLKIELTHAVSHTLALDYFLYTPTFANLADKPDLRPSSTSAPPATTTDGTEGTFTPTPNSRNGKLVGPIAGGVLGGIACLLLFLIVFVVVRQRKYTKTDSESTQKSQQPTQTPELEPFILSQPIMSITSAPKSALTISSPDLTPSGGYTDTSTPDPGPSHGMTEMHAPQHKPSLTAISSITPSMSASRLATQGHVTIPTSQHNITSHPGGEVGPGFRTRMRRLEELVQELNQEIEVEGGDTMRVVELRGRIAELTRQDSEVVNSTPNVAPPAYEPREE